MYKISNNSEVVIFLLGEMRWNDSYIIKGQTFYQDVREGVGMQTQCVVSRNQSHTAPGTET